MLTVIPAILCPRGRRWQTKVSKGPARSLAHPAESITRSRWRPALKKVRNYSLSPALQTRSILRSPTHHTLLRKLDTHYKLRLTIRALALVVVWTESLLGDDNHVVQRNNPAAGDAIANLLCSGKRSLSYDGIQPALVATIVLLWVAERKITNDIDDGLRRLGIG